VSPSTIDGLAPSRTQLDNGLVVLAKETRVTPAVAILATVRAGSRFDPADRPGVAYFVSRTLDRGTSGRSAAEIADSLENRGVSLALGVSRHVLSLSCACLREDLDAGLGMIAEILTHPAFPHGEVETKRGEIITFIRQDEDNPASVASEQLMHLLYGPNHPFGRRARGTIASVSAIDAAALRDFHSNRIQPAVTSLIMVGDVAAEHAAAAAERAFGSWRGSAQEPNALVPPDAATERRVRIVPMMNKAQADIAYGFTTITRADPRYYSYWLMNNILGQYSMGGRLGDSIRERQGMAYYAYSAFDADLIPGPLIVRAGVNPANVERAVASIDVELTRIADAGPTDDELAESRQYLIGSLPRTLETNGAIAGFLQSVEFFGLGLDYDRRIPGLLSAVTRDQAHEAARNVLNPAKATVVVAGPYAGTLA
jgi:zinc protease